MSRWSRFVMALTAFREAYFASGPAHEDDFCGPSARQMRYELGWALVENSVYRKVHTWSTSFLHTYGLGKYTRSIYNPASRLVSCHEALIWGGNLDPVAGDSGAIPIATDDDDLRVAIAEVWARSNFAQLKDTIVKRGAAEGDCFVRVVDNPDKELVYLERLDPSTVADITKDEWNNCKGYVIVEERQDPASVRRKVTFREEVTREGDDVVTKTYKNNKPYGWDGNPAEWSEPYTFVPLVHWAYNDVGLKYGWSELHPLLSLIREADDLASMFTDFIRKNINPTWLVPGAKPRTSLAVAGAAADVTGAAETRPEPGREEQKLIWLPPSVDATKIKAMIAQGDVSGWLQHLDGILKEIERELPELQQDIWATGSTSGRALRVARQRVEQKIQLRRAGCDDGLTRALKMAISIGGMRGYPGYEPFNLDSFEAGDLEFTIAPRSVFTPDPLDAIEIEAEMWAAVAVATKAGASLEGALKRHGLDDEAIEELIGEEEEPVAPAVPFGAPVEGEEGDEERDSST